MASYPYAVTGLNTTTTQTPKPPKPLPTWDNTVQNVPLTAPQQPAVSTDLNVANDQVMNTAQNKAVQGYSGGVLDQLAASTSNLLKDPSMGKDYTQEKQLALEQQNRGMNQQLETLRQQTAPQAYTGQNLRDLTNVAMQNVKQKADTSRAIDIEQNKAQREAAIAAITAGLPVAAQQRGAFDQDIQNLLGVRAGYEGEANRQATASNLDKVFLQDIEKLTRTQDWQGVQSSLDRELAKATSEGNWENAKEIQKMQGDLEIKKLVSTQDWQGAQNSLDRQLQEASKNGDWENAINLIRLKGEIDAKAEASRQEFAKGERIATQGWQTNERISSQDYNTASKYIDAEIAKAASENDFTHQSALMDQKAMIDLKMQTNEMNQQEKMAYLNDNLATARANGDVERQKIILTFQHTQEMEALDKTQGHDVAMAYLKNNFDLAMQSNDFVQAQTLQRIELEATASEAAKDRVLEQARIALTQKGLDMQKVEQQYNFLNSEIEAGRIAPDAAVNYLKSQLAGTGVEITAVDASVAAKEAIDADYEAQKYTWAKSHPNLVANGTLTPEGERQFLEFINKSVYQETTVKDLINGIADAKELQGGANPKSASNAEYNALLNTADVWMPEVSNDGRGFWTPDVRTINNAPEKGRYFKSPSGTLYLATSGIVEETSGQNYQYFTAIDVNTGNTVRIRANEAGNGVDGYSTRTNDVNTNM